MIDGVGLVTEKCKLCCLRIQDLNVIIERKEIIKGINLHIHCGDLIGLLGPNGAGKTTLIRSIIGEIPHGGSIDFVNVHKRSKRLTIGYTPQKLLLEKNSPITVLDLFLTKISKKPVCFFHSNADICKVKEILSIVKAEHLIRSKLGNLSGGELQRTLLAYALYPVPNILLLDEPVAGVDQEGMRMFYSIVSELRSKFDLSIILITHDPDSIASYANRFMFLDRTIQYEGNYVGLIEFMKKKNGEDIV